MDKYLPCDIFLLVFFPQLECGFVFPRFYSSDKRRDPVAPSFVAFGYLRPWNIKLVELIYQTLQRNL